MYVAGNLTAFAQINIASGFRICYHSHSTRLTEGTRAMINNAPLLAFATLASRALQMHANNA